MLGLPMLVLPKAYLPILFLPPGPSTKYSVNKTKVSGVLHYHLTTFAQAERGSLVFGEVGNGLAFTPERFFTVFGVPTGLTRGYHAHK
jgi:UDP-2-acetamido-3-amino-2,3-dideoxy-glucuronate N-acetyltransferase